MKHYYGSLGSLVGALAFLATATPAFAQSKHTAVSNDGSVVAPAGEAAGPSAGGGGTSAAPSAGARRVTELGLIADGVSIDAESAAEYRRLSALPDGAERGTLIRNSAAEVIIGPDTRERLYTNVYPSRAKVLITFSGGRCSGVMIGRNTVATAGHCVHTGGPGGAWRPVASFRVYPGRDGGASPYGVCTARTLYSVVGWTGSSNEEYDYGAIKLNCNVGNTVGWFGMTTATPTNFPSIVGGYPGDKPLTQWQGSDRVRALSTRQAFYRNDTVGGMSGSAVWYDQNGPYLYSIHAYGTHGAGNHALYNHGVRLVTAVFNNLVAWKNVP
jgi:glutamyl endopeptidase